MDEHKLAWELMRKAGGEDRSTDEFFAEVQSAEDSPEHIPLLRELYLFENTWFPRLRAIIQRFLPPDARDEFDQAFFKDLSQRALGPMVVRSVSPSAREPEGPRDERAAVPEGGRRRADRTRPRWPEARRGQQADRRAGGPPVAPPPCRHRPRRRPEGPGPPARHRRSAP
jgi:hypothetical protein